MKSYLKKAYCINEDFRIYAAITTDIVKYAQECFNLWPSSCEALGRVLTIGAIMSCTYKNNDFINIKVNTTGPIGKIVVEGNNGNVRGFVENPGVFLVNNDGTLNITKAIESGDIQVIKDLHLREPFVSSSEIIKGDITNDFTYYFTKSEQIPSSVGLQVSFGEDDKVKSAGGFLIQVMPGAKEESIKTLEENLKNLKPITKMIDEGYEAEDIINEISKGDYKILETKELNYKCNCSKERFERGLMTLKEDDLEDILNTDHKCEITCNFCNKKYVFDENDLKNIILKIKK